MGTIAQGDSGRRPISGCYSRSHNLASVVSGLAELNLTGPPDRLRQGYGGPPKLYAKAEGGHYGNVRADRGTGCEHSPGRTPPER